MTRPQSRLSTYIVSTCTSTATASPAALTSPSVVDLKRARLSSSIPMTMASTPRLSGVRASTTARVCLRLLLSKAQTTIAACSTVLTHIFPRSVATKKVRNGRFVWPQKMPQRSKRGFGIAASTNTPQKPLRSRNLSIALSILVYSVCSREIFNAGCGSASAATTFTGVFTAPAPAATAPLLPPSAERERDLSRYLLLVARARGLTAAFMSASNSLFALPDCCAALATTYGGISPTAVPAPYANTAGNTRAMMSSNMKLGGAPSSPSRTSSSPSHS
mmetsp:Transcript_31512/g.99933  ORF Transcript_31512/g.99933 Transcript_31512/m.99933 type:complete len:276 (+) Transcript_31512:1743-2570(+)